MQRKTNISLGLGVLFIALTAVGCSQKMNMDETSMQSEIKKQNKEIQDLRATTEDQEQQIQKYQSQLGAQGEMGSGQSGFELLPPGADPGQCFARVFVPPKYISRVANRS